MPLRANVTILHGVTVTMTADDRGGVTASLGVTTNSYQAISVPCKLLFSIKYRPHFAKNTTTTRKNE